MPRAGGDARAGRIARDHRPNHYQHHEPGQLVVLPPRVARHLGLNPGCGVVCNDLNRFAWVGPDVRATPNGSPYYGQIPAKLFETIRGRVIANAVRPTKRTG